MTEHQIQAAFFDWVRAKEAQDWRFGLIYAIPNGGKRHISVARKLKKEGAKSGIWDIAIDVPARGYNGARVEVKRPKQKLTPNQVVMEKLYKKANLVTYVGTNPDALINFVEAYFGL